MKYLFLFTLVCFAFFSSTSACAQEQSANKNTIGPVPMGDSVIVPPGQEVLFVLPKANLLTTHLDLNIGPSQVIPDHKSGLGFSATAKGVYLVRGAIYIDMGMGIARLNSESRPEAISNLGKMSTTALTLPIGAGFTIGDDRAMIINGIDFTPFTYIEAPSVQRLRRFGWGASAELGFHIIVGTRLHLGMMGKLHLLQSHDKDEHTDLPRFGLATVGMLLRYD